MKLSDFLIDVGRPVAFYPSLVKALGDRNEAIFICQMAYWRGKGENKEGWIYKESEEIEAETSLTYKEQINVRKGMIEKGLLEEYYARTEHKMYFKVNWDAVNTLWEQFTNGHMPPGKVADAPKEDGSLPDGSSLNSNTETPENTSPSGKPDAVDGFIKFQLKPGFIRKAFADFFKLTPNWDAKYNRQFLEWSVEMNITPEQVQQAAKVWISDKRFNWTVPTLRGIQEHWLELISTITPPANYSGPRPHKLG